MARLLAVMAVTSVALFGCDDERVNDTLLNGVAPGVERANGMPLDVVAYDPPAWFYRCSEVYKIYDRSSGHSWWLLRMSNASYVVLPSEVRDDAI